MSNEITLPEAVAMTHAYQNDPLFAGQTISAKIPNAAYLEIINQTGCVEVRTYFAKNAAGALTLVIVGVNANGNDMTAGKIMNRLIKCPNNCPHNSPLLL
jgi:hypothetical protein